MSGSCIEILNCALRRYIRQFYLVQAYDGILSIYIFAFILNWYTVESIVVENNQNKEKKANLYKALLDNKKFIN
jgi:hypothetical protein